MIFFHGLPMLSILLIRYVKQILTIIYNSLINPYLHYCILTWGSNTERLLTLQKRAVRSITNSHILAHTDNLYKDLKISKIDDILKQHQFTFYHKFLNNNLPKCISNIISKQDSQIRSCHSSFFLKPPVRVRTESAKTCVRHSIPSLINNYDRTFIENLHSISLPCLKKQFKKKTIENYHFECTDQFCYPCISRFFNPFGFSNSIKFLHIFYYMINFIYQRPFLLRGNMALLNIYNYLQNP